MQVNVVPVLSQEALLDPGQEIQVEPPLGKYVPALQQHNPPDGRKPLLHVRQIAIAEQVEQPTGQLSHFCLIGFKNNPALQLQAPAVNLAS